MKEENRRRTRGREGEVEEEEKRRTTRKRRKSLESFRSCASLRAASDHFQMSVMIFMVLSLTELPTFGIRRWRTSESANQIGGIGRDPHVSRSVIGTDEWRERKRTISAKKKTKTFCRGGWKFLQASRGGDRNLRHTGRFKRF